MPYPDLYIDQWKMKKVCETRWDARNLEDVLGEEYLIGSTNEQKYLGYVLSSNGKNTANIASRRGKGIGCVRQIISILEDIHFGHHKYKISVVLRNSILINSMLYNSEVWYALSTSEIEKLEQVDEILLRGILSLPRSTPRPFLYLELGCLQIRYILMSRRLMFLYFILSEEKHSLLYQVFQAQLSSPLKGDRIEDIRDDLKSLKLTHLSFDEVERMTKQQFKKLINDALLNEGFIYLQNLQKNLSKISHIEYGKLSIQNYLNTDKFTNLQAEFLSSLRGRMLDVRSNYKGSNKDLTCPTCSDLSKLDTQQHLLFCEELQDNSVTLTQHIVEHDDILSTTINKQFTITKILQQKFQVRKQNLKSRFST